MGYTCNMTDEILLLIGEKIRDRRLEMKQTVEQLAAKAGVTKGLISQIENNRTLPSFPVLINIIQALELELKSFFESIRDGVPSEKFLLLKAGAAAKIDKEPVKGFSYSRVFSKTFSFHAIDVVMLELKPGATRKEMVTTEAFEVKYVINGHIEYQIEKEKLQLATGDTLAFDGRLPHRIRNAGTKTALLLILYLF